MATVRKCSNVPRVITAVFLFFVATPFLVLSSILLLIKLGREVASGNTFAVTVMRLGGELSGHILFGAFVLGLALVGTAALLIIRPCRGRVALTVSAAAPAAAEAPETDKITVKPTVDPPCATVHSPCATVVPNGTIGVENKPIRIYHTRIMGTAFAEDGDRQAALAYCKVGDILALQTKAAEVGGSVVAFRTVSGTTLGLMDAALVRTIREIYPRHRIGAVIERLEGGGGRPYVGHVAVTVYYTPTAANPEKPRRARRGA